MTQRERDLNMLALAYFDLFSDKSFVMSATELRKWYERYLKKQKNRK